ncbi:hypothetical protein PR202_gb06772 [Eleusine coracana subsp. coracana]|uniref:protein-serine/threonine phosphatase n=1 Tax=Eleusine coracana subsp. coracana TaxID=191504 RepID=A0AAV5EAB3_ELECO|nr:hypothetical protein PR202_gb06772 [Eleusine coracana subsp. coracana]
MGQEHAAVELAGRQAAAGGDELSWEGEEAEEQGTARWIVQLPRTRSSRGCGTVESSSTRPSSQPFPEVKRWVDRADTITRGGGRAQGNLAPATTSLPPSRRFLLPALPFPRSEAIKPADLASGRAAWRGESQRSHSHEMVCIGSLLRALVLRTASAGAGGRRRAPRVLCGRAADVRVTHRHLWRGFRAVAGARGRMMLDSSDSAAAAAEVGAGSGQVQPQRRAAGALAQAHDAAYASGGWERTLYIAQAQIIRSGVLGHGGSRAAEYLKEHLFENLIKHPEFLTDTKLAISETYQKTDTDFLESECSAFRDDGSTASTAVLVGDRLYVANVGDSRAVISKAGKGTWRVGGVLAMSRAFGNRLLKPFVVAEPEIQEEQVDGDLECLVLASDGLWDVVENEEAVSLGKSEDMPESAARKLTEIAYSRGSADNITCIVVQFHHDKTG